jgi:tetratricopeptide (TPR) repeat protein
MQPNWRLYRLDAVLLVAVIAIVGWVYTNAWSGSFHFDDEHSLLENPHVRSLGNTADFFRDPQMFSRNKGSQMYRPLVLLSYALNYRWDGYQSSGYLVFNWLVHLAVVALAYICHRHLGLDARVAALAALIFGIHPLVAEPVNYISARSESLAALFALAALIGYLRSTMFSALMGFVAFALALMCKSTAAVLPLMFLLADLCLRRGGAVRWGRLAVYWAGLLVYLLGTQALVREALVDAPLRSPLQQIATQSKAWVYYIQLLLGMQSSSVEHQFFVAEWGQAAVWLSAAFLISAAGLLLRGLWRYNRLMLFYLSWALIALLPTFIVPLNVLVNERRLYLSLIALSALVPLWPFQLGKIWQRVAVIALVCPLAIMATQRTEIWQSEWILWQDARIQAPQMVRPHLRMGVLMRRAGDAPGALAAYQSALDIDRDNAPAHNNIGNVYRQMGRGEEAVRAYKRALEIWPEYVEALVNLASVYSEVGQLQTANALFERALKNGHQRGEIYNNMGTNYLRMGEYARAEKMLRKALKLMGNTARIHYNLGGAIEGLGEFTRALASYESALVLDSTYAPAHAKIGSISEKVGKWQKAQRHYESFLRHWRGGAETREDVRTRLRLLAEKQPLR